jgi:hypothetical protein
MKHVISGGHHETSQEMLSGVDIVWNRADSVGRLGVMRWLSEMPSGKVLTEEEVAKGESDVGGDNYMLIAVRVLAFGVVVVSGEGAEWLDIVRTRSALCEKSGRGVRSNRDEGVVVGPSGLREVYQGVGWTEKGGLVEKGVDRLQRMGFVID